MTLSLVFGTEEEALAACGLADQALGYPREDADQHGRLVVTSNWTHPIPLLDGTWAVQVPEGFVLDGLDQDPVERDLATLALRADD